MIPVLNSSVEFFYQGGTFTPNNDDWMASATQQDYHEHIDLKKNSIVLMILKTIGIISIFH